MGQEIQKTQNTDEPVVKPTLLDSDSESIKSKSAVLKWLIPLLERTLVGAGFLIVMLSAMLIKNPIPFGVLFSIIVAMMMFEFLRMTMKDHYIPLQIVDILLGVCIFLIAFLDRAHSLPAALGEDALGKCIAILAIPMIIMIIVPLLWEDKTYHKKTSYLLYALLYIALPMSLMNIGAFDEFGNSYGIVTYSDASEAIRPYEIIVSPLLILFTMVWMSDIGSYVFGMVWGQKKHSAKLCPDISPHKSWIGFVGGYIFTVITILVWHYMGLASPNIIHLLMLALVIHGGGVAGDLMESMWKRIAGIKDSGKCLPGHGGMLDRFDSAMVGVPLGLLYLFLFGFIH